METNELEKQLCSYCQREYNTMSKSGKLITRTFDHLIPKIETNNPRRIDRTGIMCKANAGNLKTEEILSLLQCCNECNNLKGSMSLKVFKIFINKIIKNHNLLTINQQRWITNKIKLNIINSINIIENNECKPIELELSPYELII